MPDRHQLQRARTVLHLSLAEAAEAVGVGRSSVSRIEAGIDTDEGLASKLTAFYEAKGVSFGAEGQIKLAAAAQKIAGRKVN